jgi:hypothetical protein
MLEHNKIKLSIMVTAITILGTVVLITNVSNTAFGQGIINDMLRLNETQDNMTQGNMSGGNMSGGNVTAVIDVDTLTQNIKERHPILAQMTAEEDQSLMSKIKGMDSKEAVKTTIALDILRLLQQYKQLDLE